MNLRLEYSSGKRLCKQLKNFLAENDAVVMHGEENAADQKRRIDALLDDLDCVAELANSIER